MIKDNVKEVYSDFYNFVIIGAGPAGLTSGIVAARHGFKAIIIEKGEDGYFISEVVELPGCHTQAKTMEELINRTKEAIQISRDEFMDLV